MVEKVTGKKKPMITCPLPIAKILAPIAELYYKITKTRPVFTRYSIETILSNSDISSEKAKKELGYHPRSMLESITDTVRWWGDHLGMVKRSLRIKEN
jgi:dihydroflavonol-4-reductase